MSKIKLVAMDLDNTLLDSEKQISKHTEEVLKEAIRRGVYIVPATGRIFKAIPEFLRDIPGVRYAVCCNGATAVSYTHLSDSMGRFISMPSVCRRRRLLNG